MAEDILTRNFATEFRVPILEGAENLMLAAGRGNFNFGADGESLGDVVQRVGWPAVFAGAFGFIGGVAASNKFGSELNALELMNGYGEYVAAAGGTIVTFLPFYIFMHLIWNGRIK